MTFLYAEYSTLIGIIAGVNIGATMKYILFILLLVLAGCQEPILETEPVIKMQTIKTRDITISVPVYIKAETIFPIKIKFPNEATIISSRVIGITMDMGIIPVMFNDEDKTKTTYNAQLLVGACTAVVMRSRLEIVWQHNGQEKSYYQVITINR